jgi:tetracycline repressor-like protein
VGDHGQTVGAAEVLRRGVERGELRADLDVDVAIDALYGAIYYRLLVSHHPLSTEYAHSVVDEVFDGLRAPGLG